MLMRISILVLLLLGGCGTPMTAAEQFAYKCEWSSHFPEVWGKCPGDIGGRNTGMTPEIMGGGSPGLYDVGPRAPYIVQPSGGGYVVYPPGTSFMGPTE